MSPIKIGIIKEGRIPRDLRAPFTPYQTNEIRKKFPDTEVYVQACDYRCFKNEEYEKLGTTVKNDISFCDCFFGIKEVPVTDLVENKSYFIFSHTMKKQEHNRKLLQTILQKKVRLIDYECMCDLNGIRILGFGNYAGVVGTYNAFLAFGLKNNIYQLRYAHHCGTYHELTKEFSKIKLPPIKIIYTGGGRVASGVSQILDALNIKRVKPYKIITGKFSHPVYAQLIEQDYNLPKNGSHWNTSDFYAHPENYKADFSKYLPHTDIIIHSAFWNTKAPVFFTKEEMKKPEFKPTVIADIACDLKGPIPSTLKPCTIEAPVYGYAPITGTITQPHTRGNIDVMAVDNLPCSLPRDSSQVFGKDLLNKILPCLLIEDKDKVIERATITENGKLNSPFEYLSDFVYN